MKNLNLKYIIFTLLTTFSLEAAFLPAIESDVDEVQKVTSHLRKFQAGNLMIVKSLSPDESFTLGITDDDSATPVSVLVRKSSWFSPTLNHEKICDSFLPIVKEKIKRDRAIYFVGTEEGAAIASQLAYLFKQGDSSLVPNQVKVLLFSVSPVSEDLVPKINDTLGQGNILNFFNSGFIYPAERVMKIFRQSDEVLGVPLMILPSETIYDTFSSKRAVTTVSLSVAQTALALYVAYNFPQFRKDNSFSVWSLYALAEVCADIIKSKYIPSNVVIKMALEYAFDNIKTNREEGYNLDSVGVPPLLSTRRGISGAFWKLATS